MTTKEFSDAFDTLIASYNHKSEFGDQSSIADVSLDEYEKSIFLTQALDNIVKSYFSRNANSTGEGFDDSIRRLVDFSSLIAVKLPTRVASSNAWNKGLTQFNGTTNTLRGTGSSYLNYKVVVKFGESADSVNTSVLNGGFIITLNISSATAPSTFFTNNLQSALGGITFQHTNSEGDNYLGIMNNTTAISDKKEFTINSFRQGETAAYDERGILFTLPTDILLMLNERIKSTEGKYCVVVPISYKEYDRLMSRAYALPLKKQCWRLYEGESSTNIISEIIPKEGIDVDFYKIRYIRRPKPIILTDLDLVESQEALEIDGESKVSECELNPILHMDILELAVRLALNSKGIETREQKAAREAARNRS